MKNQQNEKVCTREFILTFGKYKGKTLGEVADIDSEYIEWLDDEKVLKIEKNLLEAVKMDIMEEESNFFSALESWNGD